MPIELDQQETREILASLQRYFSEELEQEISEMRAKFLLDYILKEIAPVRLQPGRQGRREFLSRQNGRPARHLLRRWPDLLAEKEKVRSG